jgi:hypothetical protein
VLVPVELELLAPHAASAVPTSTTISGAATRVAASIRLFRMSIVSSSSRCRKTLDY